MSRASISVRRVLAPRRRAAGLALLLVAVQGAGLAHLLFERHEVCPEHGELVHAGDGHGAHGVHAPKALAPAADSSGLAVRAPHSSAGEHGDDHCDALATRRELAILPANSHGLLLAAAVQPGGAPASSEARLEPRARYDVAPKQSPPV
jgi:hypothetical protein